MSQPQIKEILTKNLIKNEDKGWIGNPDKRILQTLVAMLHACRASTKLSQITDREKILKIKDFARASLPLENQESEPLPEPPANFLVTGAHLSQATQSMLYKGILEVKRIPSRAASSLNLEITRSCVEELTKKLPNNQNIWLSLRSKVFSPQTHAFLWKTMHSAYKIGRYWSNIPTLEQRGICHACNGVEESMEHILTECKASGQEVIWNLASELWALRGLPWNKPRFGTILGCGFGDFHPENEKATRLTGANRLYAILLSESAYQIWKAWCKWKISDGASPEKFPTRQELRVGWIKNLNRRLQLERLMTNKPRYGQKALKPKLVERTWWGVLQNQESLQDDWLKKGTEVLVGIDY